MLLSYPPNLSKNKQGLRKVFPGEVPLKNSIPDPPNQTISRNQEEMSRTRYGQKFRKSLNKCKEYVFHIYSTVTDLARLRGLSTSNPRATDTKYAKSWSGITLTIGVSISSVLGI